MADCMGIRSTRLKPVLLGRLIRARSRLPVIIHFYLACDWAFYKGNLMMRRKGEYELAAYPVVGLVTVLKFLPKANGR